MLPLKKKECTYHALMCGVVVQQPENHDKE
jgi:hypothetical protein